MFGVHRQAQGTVRGATTPPAVFSLSPLLGSLPIAIIATDLQGVVLAWNAHAEKVYGWAADEASRSGRW